MLTVEPWELITSKGNSVEPEMKQVEDVHLFIISSSLSDVCLVVSLPWGRRHGEKPL